MRWQTSNIILLYRLSVILLKLSSIHKSIATRRWPFLVFLFLVFVCRWTTCISSCIAATRYFTTTHFPTYLPMLASTRILSMFVIVILVILLTSPVLLFLHLNFSVALIWVIHSNATCSPPSKRLAPFSLRVRNIGTLLSFSSLDSPYWWFPMHSVKHQNLHRRKNIFCCFYVRNQKRWHQGLSDIHQFHWNFPNLRPALFGIYSSRMKMIPSWLEVQWRKRGLLLDSSLFLSDAVYCFTKNPKVYISLTHTAIAPWFLAST